MPTNQNDQTEWSQEKQKSLEDMITKFGNSSDETKSDTYKPAQVKTTNHKKVKEIRMFADHLLIQSKRLSSTREISLAYTNMQRGFMWLGVVLSDINEPNPYPESTNTASDKIEERTDQAKDSPDMFEGCPDPLDRTACVKWFRLQLDVIMNRVDFPQAWHDSQLALDAFQEAKMWFGQELNNIRLASV